MSLAERHFGATATRTGLTEAQLAAAREVIEQAVRDGYTRFHHGDCVGGDVALAGLARRAGLTVEDHPATLRGLRGHFGGDVTHPPRPPLTRNDDIVAVCDHLLAAPDGETERLRSGTWATVRRARQLGRELTIVYPDGSVTTSR